MVVGTVERTVRPGISGTKQVVNAAREENMKKYIEKVEKMINSQHVKKIKKIVGRGYIKKEYFINVCQEITTKKRKYQN